MTRRARALLVLLGALAAAAPPATATAPDDNCAVPTEFIKDDPKLPVTGERLRDGKPLRIVAIGGSSTAGAAAGATDKGWPKRLEETLAKRFPKAAVTVVNKGVPRQTAHEMVDRFDRDVFPEQPVLVIWETGTTDAVRGIDVDEFSTTLQAGIDKLRQHNVETMLVDMQFSRATSSVINFERYLDALRRIADVNDIFVFKRYEVMRYWVEHGVFNFEDVPPAARAELAARVYQCLGYRLADAIEIASE
jgi:lysophospholipase L1-like esterase